MGVRMSEKWFAFKTVPQREFRAKQEIIARGYRALVPFEVEERRGRSRNGRPYVSRVEVPLMRGYCFAGFEHHPQLDEMSGLEDVFGRRLLIGYCSAYPNGPPVMIRPAELTVLRELSKGLGINRLPTSPRRAFRVGQKLDIVDGPFRNFAGVVEEIGRQRIKVAIEIFGRYSTVAFSPDQVEVA
jgi:transcription antitermination factor NusG